MRRLSCLASACLAVGLSVVSLPARAQAPGTPTSLPLVVDMRKVALGSWAEYAAKVGDLTLSSRWTLVARDRKSNTIEMTTRGKAISKPIVLRVVLAADPTSDEKPPRPMVVQLGGDPPMMVPKDMPAPKFQRPDPKSLVGSEEIKVPAGTFKTLHYREKNDAGTVDIWVSEAVAPIGVVKATTTPLVDKSQPAAMQTAPFSQELAATGQGGKASITKRPRPFDDQKMRGLIAP